VAGTAAPLNPGYREDEVNFYLDDTSAKVLLCPADAAGALKAAEARGVPVYALEMDSTGYVRIAGAPGGKTASAPAADDTALILHTSGSTGRPKRVPIKHGNMAASTHNIMAHYALAPEDVSLCVMPLFHVHGLVASTLSTLLSGGTVVVPSKFNPLSFWRTVRDAGATWYSAVPTIHNLLLAQGERGEVVIQGPNVVSGYENNPEANAKSFTHGWFRTGDQGFLDEDGYLTLTGRLKEMINRGGEKIGPREIDEVLLSHPSVAEAVAFGVPHPGWGEEVAAAVVLREGADTGEPEILAFCKERLADFKRPKKIYITSAIPRTATGKIQRGAVAKALAG
jgi:acyl-CoA synthetase (AMP-forming)/AMP-acid ligase II